MSKPEKIEEKTENKLILIYYISIRNIPQEDIQITLERISQRIDLDKDNIPNFGVGITVPTYGETRIECINPQYICNDDLIKKHERLMAELHESMRLFIDNNNKNKNKNE